MQLKILQEIIKKKNDKTEFAIITNLETAKNFAKHCKETYYEDFAMITFFTDITVMRPEKF